MKSKSESKIERQARMLAPKVREFITKAYGKKCDQFASHCACCIAWHGYDEIFEVFEDEKR